MTLTIFTPTYNRASTLRRTFDSLMRQSQQDFEWLVVDDGSTDDTERTVRQFASTAPFAVRYVRQPHGGKHRAYNRALSLAEGELFFTVDSDDWLEDDSVETIVRYREVLAQDSSLCGMAALKRMPEGAIYGSRFPQSPMTGTLREFEKAGCRGERSYVLKTDLARRYPFPELDGERFVTECVVYDRIGNDYGFLAVNKVLTICEYQASGLSSNIYRLMWDNPRGFVIYHGRRIDNSDGVCEAMRYALRYVAFRAISGGRADYKPRRYRFLVGMLSPLGRVGRWYYKSKCRLK